VEESFRAKNQLDSSSRFDTIALVTDGRTDGQTDVQTDVHTRTVYTALAWRRAMKNERQLSVHRLARQTRDMLRTSS